MICKTCTRARFDECTGPQHRKKKKQDLCGAFVWCIPPVAVYCHARRWKMQSVEQECNAQILSQAANKYGNAGISPLANIPTLDAGERAPRRLRGVCEPYSENLRFSEWVLARSASPNKNTTQFRVVLLFGDPYGNRTHVSALRGPCLSLLTNGPWFVAILLYYIFFGLSIAFLNFFKKMFFASALYALGRFWQK